jgi:hypothetical protein
MKSSRHKQVSKSRRKQRGSFQPSFLLNLLLNRLHSFKLKAIPLSLMLGLSAVSAPSMSANNLSYIGSSTVSVPYGSILNNVSSNYINGPAGNLKIYGAVTNSSKLYIGSGGSMTNFSNGFLVNSIFQFRYEPEAVTIWVI